MANNAVKTNSARAWLLASRPKTLISAAVPVMIGTALALKNTGWNIKILPAVLCLLFAFIMQINANFVNDYYDFLKGNDDSSTRLGPLRACSQGWITIKAMRRAIIFVTILACAIGLPLIYYGGWSMIFIGLICIIFCVLYTTKLSYIALGDVLVVVFFGIIPVITTYYLEVSTISCITIETLAASIACGLVIDALLIVNNYRDIDNDKAAGKNTLVVMIGAANSRTLYLFVGFTACLIGVIFAFNGAIFATVLPMFYLISHVFTYIKMKKINKGKQLNIVLGNTARNIFIYGLMVVVGLLIG